MSHVHFRKVCAEHKITIASCRCPGPKNTQIVPCPGASCPGNKPKPERPRAS